MGFFETLLGRNTKTRNRKPGRRIDKGRLSRFESLEPRQMLAGDSIFSQFQGTLGDGNVYDVIPITVSPEQLSLNQTAYLSFAVEPAPGSALDPRAITITDSKGRTIAPAVSNDNVLGGRGSLTLAQLSAGEYKLHVVRENATSGVYRVSVGMVGDVNGSRQVDQTDGDAIRMTHGAIFGDDRYSLDTDLDKDGTISAADLMHWERGFSGTTPKLGPVQQTVGGPQDRIPALTPQTGHKANAPMQFYESTRGWVQPLETESPEIASGVIRMPGDAEAMAATEPDGYTYASWGTSDDKEVLIQFKIVSREASYQNSLYYYKTDADGKVNGFSPGQTGYIGTAYADAVKIFDKSDPAGKTVDIRIAGGQHIAYFLIQDDDHEGNLWFSIADANKDDEYVHFVATISNGVTTYNVEDLSGSSSVANARGYSETTPDFDDLIFSTKQLPLVGIAGDTHTVEADATAITNGTNDKISFYFVRQNVDVSTSLTVNFTVNWSSVDPIPFSAASQSDLKSDEGRAQLLSLSATIPAGEIQSAPIVLHGVVDTTNPHEGIEAFSVAVATGTGYGITNKKIDDGKKKEEVGAYRALEFYILDDVQYFVVGSDDAGLYGVIPTPTNPGIHETDVRQGGLGDCYFLAAVLTLVHKGHWQLIKDKFQTDPETGSPAVELYKLVEGQRQETLVPIDVELTQGYNMALLSRDTEDGKVEIWPQMLEQAYANMNEGYGAIVGGTAGEAWTSLTNKPATHYSTVGKTDAEIVTMINNAVSAGKYVAVTTYEKFASTQTNELVLNSSIPAPNTPKLYGNHTYVFDGIVTEQGQSNSLKLLNPWGKENVQLPYNKISQGVDGIYVLDPP
ncbi:MAG: C2 family cysteine protease [Planctomycetota bacterium]|nr:C2 family cysteine protease [Planctomycetota bacterium]